MATKYFWQRRNKGNRNHFICEVFDKVNPNDRPVWSTYFDGTQSQALRYFSRHKKIRSYMEQQYHYDVVVRANSIVMNWIDTE